MKKHSDDLPKQEEMDKSEAFPFTDSSEFLEEHSDRETDWPEEDPLDDDEAPSDEVEPEPPALPPYEYRESWLEENTLEKENYIDTALGTRRHAADILKHAGWMVERHDGIEFQCGETIKDNLIELGLGRGLDGEPLKTSKAIGDALGDHEGSLDAVYVVIRGKKFYHLPSLGASNEVKEKLRADLAKQKKSNPLEFRKIDRA